MSLLGSLCFRRLGRYFSLFLILGVLLLVTQLCTIDNTLSKIKLDSNEQRISRIGKSCRKPTEANMDLIFYSKADNLCYCGTAKAGCTFWKQVIRFLNHDTGDQTYQHPLDIPRDIVHWGMKHTTQTDFYKLKQYFSNYERFMFVRNPFTRLWSAYIDKVFLPDHWGHPFVSGLTSSKCPLNATFEDFVKRVLVTPVGNMDSHWVPMSYSCDPCTFQPTFLGKMETFAADVRHLLSRHNLSWIVDSHASKHNEDEMKMLIRYNYNLFVHEKIRECITTRGMAIRLWKVFQLNGHLSNDENLRLPKHGTITEKEFEALAVDASKRQNMSPAALKEQKKLHLKQAYESLSLTTITAIREKYASDFDMFGYDEIE
ncbi:carbohydrate sulfotransferase 9-like [Haliotis cracherodii]|uniref:carbohydrate sulfotransferase 9-like n=1 Tax=Haliotis cracherodii TaxID=6455 RepID=UPI0039E8D9B1